MIVAEQVAAALEGGLVTNAVNIPTVGADDLEVLGPYLPLAAKLGRLAMQLAGGDVGGSQIEVYGELAEYDTRLLTVAALNGAFQGQTDQPVNYVNAPVIAADRGIEVVEEKRRVVARLHEPRRRHRRRRARRRHDDRQRGTGTGSSRRSASSSRWSWRRAWSLLRYDDVPGVIGRVGTLFGDAGVNIANMAVSRNREGRQGADGATRSTRPRRPSCSTGSRGHRRRLRHPDVGSGPGRARVEPPDCLGQRRPNFSTTV